MAAERAQNLQDTFLNHVRKNKTPLTIFLVNGVKLQGVVTWFDNFCVLLRRDGHSQLVYKHAISTIMPGHPIQLFEGGRGGCRPGKRHSLEPRRLDKHSDRLSPREGSETGRAIVIEPHLRVRASSPAVRTWQDGATAARSKARRSGRARPRHRSQRGQVRHRAGWRHSPGHFHRQGQGRGDRRPGQRRRSRHRGDGLRAVAGAAAQSREGLGREGCRSYRADPGDFRPPRTHPRRRTTGGACSSDLSEEPTGALLDASRAPARRLRLSWRPRRDASSKPTGA